MKERILNLTLKKKWFDLIASGKKKIEYREIKKYWIQRLFNNNGREFRPYDFIIFRNGYKKDSPKMKIVYRGLSIKEFEGKDHYALHLGKIIEIDNYSF